MDAVPLLECWVTVRIMGVTTGACAVVAVAGMCLTASWWVQDRERFRQELYRDDQQRRMSH